MTTTGNDNQEPDMTAATVEAHTEPHRFPANEQADTPAVTSPPAPTQELEATPEFKARLKAMMGSVRHVPEEDAPVHESLAEQRRATYREAWANSIKAANLADRAQWTLDRLATDQHPAPLRQYVGSIGTNARVLNLILGGRVGPGKTSAAIAAGHAAVERDLLVRVVRHNQYLKWLRPDGTPQGLYEWQIRQRFRACDLLILDDLGMGLDTDREASQFVRDETITLIGDRIESGKATIITTNVTSAQYDDTGALVGGLALMLGEQFLSRVSERGHALKFTGQDRRGRLSW